MDLMELTQTPDGLVTRLALIRGIRAVPCKSLARQVGVDASQVWRWETGVETPPPAMFKRLGLALGWPWHDLACPPMASEDAWQSLVTARKNAAVAEG